MFSIFCTDTGKAFAAVIAFSGFTRNDGQNHPQRGDHPILHPNGRCHTLDSRLYLTVS